MNYISEDALKITKMFFLPMKKFNKNINISVIINDTTKIFTLQRFSNVPKSGKRMVEIDTKKTFFITKNVKLDPSFC